MTFNESVDSIAALSGEVIDLEIWGNDGASVAFFSGPLRRMPDVDGPIPDELLGEKAVVFIIGDGTVSLWPSRFLGGERLPEGRGWVELRTEDALLRIGLKRRAWID